MELIVRRKRVNEFGEWEFECAECLLWLPKKRFRGCVQYIDGFGNCLLCSSCRGRKSQEKRADEDMEEVKRMLRIMGYDPDAEKPVWQQFHDKHNLPYPKKYL